MPSGVNVKWSPGHRTPSHPFCSEWRSRHRAQNRTTEMNVNFDIVGLQNDDLLVREHARVVSLPFRWCCGHDFPAHATQLNSRHFAVPPLPPPTSPPNPLLPAPPHNVYLSCHH